MRSFWALAVVALATLLVGVVAVQPASAAPAITTVSPTTMGQGATAIDLVVNGSGFDATGGAPNVTISGTGVTVNSTVMNSSVKLTANLTVASNATVGARTVTVSQGIGGLQTTSCTTCFAITAGPTISGAPSPSSAPNTGGPSTLVTVSGTNFVAGAELRMQRANFSDIVATGVAVSGGGTSISGTFNFIGQAAALWKVVVINPDKGRAEFGNTTTTGFLISGATPTLTNVAPSTRSSGTNGTVLTLTGTNFARGATVTFSPNAGGTEITTSNPTWVSLTTFQVTVNISGAAASGARNVTFTNFDTQPATCNACFTVTGPPTVSGVAPSSRGQGAANQDLVVTGTGFVDEPTVTFSGTGITVNNVTFDGDTQLTVNVSVASGAATGARTLTVTNPDGGSDTTTFTVNPAPTVSSATPASRGQNAQAQDIVITGTNFVNGAGLDVAFSGTGVTIAAPPTFTDVQHITAHVNVASNAPTTARDVTVTNPDKGVGTGVGKFTVVAGPTISTIVPNALGRGVSHQQVIINGGGFQSTPTVKFFNGVTEDANITVHSVVRDSATHLTLDVSVSNADTAGLRDVLVTNPDAGNVTAQDAFTVTDPPSVDTITPTSSGQGSTITGATITGSGFTGTPTITFSGTGVTATNVVRDSGAHLTFTLNVAGTAAATARDVTVTNPDSGSDTLAAAFTVVAGPHITSITPNSGANTGTVTITNLAGSGFAANAQVTLVRTGFAAVDMQGESVNGGGTQIQGTFPLASGGAGGAPVAPGVWSVKVVNPTTNGTDTLANGFTVTSNAPTVTGTYTQQQGTSFPRTVTGTNFADGAVVTVSGTGVTAGPTTVTDATHLTVTLTVSSSAALGARNITVTNADTQAGTCTGCLTIRTSPNITSLNPNARGQGTSHKSVAVNGTGFDATSVVTFSGTGITVHSTTHNSAVLLTLDISIDPSAAVGARDVTITNSDGGTNTLQEGFTVTAKPVITNLNPNARGQGVSHTSVAVNGTGFDSAPTVTFSGTGITVHSATRNSAILLTLDLSIDPAATVGARDVTVTNADGGASTSAGAFTVTAKPTITSATPNAMAQGATGNVVLAGANFVTTPTVVFSGTGITVNTVTRNSSAQLTVNVTITSGATTGSRNITVTNPDQGTSTAVAAFSVNPLNGNQLQFQSLGGPIIGSPGLTSFSPNTAVVVATLADQSIQVRGLSNGVWTPFASIGGSALDGPGTSTRQLNTFDVFVQGTDHGMYQNTCSTAGGCGAWVAHGGFIKGTPASVSWDSNRIDVFVRGSDDGMYQRFWTNGTWSNWVAFGGVLTSSPTVTSTAPNQLTVAVRGTDGAVWFRNWNGTSWSGWTSAGGQIKDQPALVAQPGGRIDLFARGTDDEIWRSRNFGAYSPLGGILSAGPAGCFISTSGGGVIELGIRSSDNNLYVAQRAFP
ncbi:MAG: hypothetical protein QOI95_331 [Acidimicrobiaceae bacterium]|jgi:hypothetical protein